jgi:hypothetical protein
MFPPTETRIKTFFRRSIDAAIDFATLGEYGLASAWEDPAAATGSGTPRAHQDTPSLMWRAGAPAAEGATPRSATLLQPASAAARALRNEERREAPVCAGQPLRSRALEPTLPRTARKRGGMAPREQRCLFDAA